MNSVAEAKLRTIKQDYNQAISAVKMLSDSGLLKNGQQEVMLLTLTQQLTAITHRAESYTSISTKLTTTVVPLLNRTKVEGMIALREWNVGDVGVFKPIFMSHNGFTWKEISIADMQPTATNYNGLYARKISPAILDSYHSNFLSGFVELKGRIVEHSDGVVRAEFARILSIFIVPMSETSEVDLCFGQYEKIAQAYPTTPVYVLSDYQYMLMLMREVLISAGIVDCYGRRSV